MKHTSTNKTTTHCDKCSYHGGEWASTGVVGCCNGSCKCHRGEKSPEEILHDKNGHAVNKDGEPVFDKECSVCVSSKDTCEEEKGGWEERFDKLEVETWGTMRLKNFLRSELASQRASILAEVKGVMPEIVLENKLHNEECLARDNSANESYCDCGDYERNIGWNAALTAVKEALSTLK